MVKFVVGDLFDTSANIIAHGVNCKGGFGSGIALGVRTLYPNVRQDYIKKFNTKGWKLGQVQFVSIGDNKYIANCATQYDYLPRDVCHVNYIALRKCMEIVKLYAMTNKFSIAAPRIGAGLGGGDWNRISKILEEVFVNYDITIYEL